MTVRNLAALRSHDTRAGSASPTTSRRRDHDTRTGSVRRTEDLGLVDRDARAYAWGMRERRAEDPADVIVAWEAVEELLAVVPESPTKDVLRMLAAGLSTTEIGHRLCLSTDEVDALAARGRVRVLTAALPHPPAEHPPS